MRQRYLMGPMVMRLLPVTHCNNRPFFRLAVTRDRSSLKDGFIEDLGSIDPMPNRYNEIIVGLNVERIKYYLGKKLLIKGQAGHFLGLAGLLPVHPSTFRRAYKLREQVESSKAEEAKPAAVAAQSG